MGSIDLLREKFHKKLKTVEKKCVLTKQVRRRKVKWPHDMDRTTVMKHKKSLIEMISRNKGRKSLSRLLQGIKSCLKTYKKGCQRSDDL